jgi:hypothetical protein
MRRLLLALVTLLIAAAPASAQIDVEQCTRYRVLIQAVIDGTDPNAESNLVDISQAPRCFMLFAAGQDRLDRWAFKDFVQRLESSRADKQTGAASAGTGGTSPIAQGPVAKVLSVAAEYGALTQTVSKQVVTVRGNLAGLPSALVQQDIFPYCVGAERTRGYCVDKSMLGILKRFSFAVSFDPSRPQTLAGQADTSKPAAGDAQPVTFTGSSREISAISARVEIWNKRDTSTPEFADAWRKKVPEAMNKVSTELLTAGDLVVDVMALKTFDAWTKASIIAVRDAKKDRAKVIAALSSSLSRLVTLASDRTDGVPQFDQRVSDALAAYSRFFLAQDDLIEPLATKHVLAFEFTNARPALQASTSNYRVILDYPLSKSTKVVANGAVTFYNSVPAGQTIVKKYRDAQAGVELDHSLGNLAIVGPAIFSAAGYFQYQHAPALLQVDPSKPLDGISFIGLSSDAKKIFATTGNIWLLQAKLSLVSSGSSVKVPVSVTWSNRTELIDKAVLRGQIGISYDLDSVFAGLKKP